MRRSLRIGHCDSEQQHPFFGPEADGHPSSASEYALRSFHNGLGEEGLSGRGLESRLALLPAEIRDYSSIPVGSDEEIICEASHVGDP